MGSEAAERFISPYLVVSRLRGERWPAEAPLPLNGRDIAGAIAVITGGIGVILIGIGLARVGPVFLFTEVGLIVGAMLGMVLAFAWSATRRPSPLTWYIAMAHFGVGPVLLLGEAASAAPAAESPSMLPVITGGLWLLYFARRRAMYGLPPWEWTQ